MLGPRIFEYRDAGLLGPDIIFSHCNELYDHKEPDDEMWAVMKDNGCAISATPVDEMNMAHGLPVAFEAVERGVKCGLGAVSVLRPEVCDTSYPGLDRAGYNFYKWGRHVSADAHSFAIPPRYVEVPDTYPRR